MSDEHVELDNESRSLLGELWETPVGRRSVLKAGLGSAVALGVGFPGEKASARPAAKRGPRRMETTDLHFVFGHMRGVSGLTLVANGERMPLARQTKASREALTRQGGLWRSADLSKLSHYASGVRLPSDRSMLISMYGKRGRREVVVGHMWYVPRAATIADAKAMQRLKGSFGHALSLSPRLDALGLKPSQIRTARDVAQLETIGDADATAVALALHHPNIATINSTNTTTTKALLGQTPAVGSLARYIQQMQQQGKDFASRGVAKDPDGTPTQISVPIKLPNRGVIGHKISTFNTYQLSPDPGLRQSLKSAVSAGIVGVRNTASLGAVIDKPLEQDASASTQTWVQEQGVMAQAQPYSEALKADSGISINVKNPGFWYGTQTVVNGGYDNGRVPLKLYNNFVRWVWVYVQYLGANNENLSANPSPTWPDTKYSQSLGLLPQVFTVLGVPLWDTNSIDVTLDFPEGAHTARILFCGLGSNLLDGGWRQYFPSDAYPHAIAPQDEVLFPSLTTGIFTIGLNALALAVDIDVAAAWSAAKPLLTDYLFLNLAMFEDLIQPTLPLVAGESVALAVAGGAETYASVSANGGSTENIWSILLALGTAIPKLLFSPKILEVFTELVRQQVIKLAGRVAGLTAAEKLVEALPVIGQVLAVIEAVGDAATLAEVCIETAVAPWVIENEVTVTYPATITINRDPQDATFPKTATSWALSPKVDGAVVVDPVTGTINTGGPTRSDPLMVKNVTAPFGGLLIQWCVTFSNSAGKQVGAGVSAQFTNNDPANPASAVTITIKEVAATIDAKTVFKRADTTAYSSAAGGYTWSNEITDSGTVMSSHKIQQVIGTTISTLAGVAGVVWEQGDRFYVRGVPVAQNGATISLGLPSNEGYVRRPFLLFDSFADKADEGNHVLLEPDPSTPAYHVRKVSLDPATGAPTWDSNVSYGTFLLPVSAAALHSSGRVVAIHTTTGRVGQLLPFNANASLAQLADYTAGAGTQIGLLSSPTAVAVTTDGTVLVLEVGAFEAAGARLAAFDLNGAPKAYFEVSVTRRALLGRKGKSAPRRGASGQGQFTLPLVSPGTYLDLAVDGVGQMYVLYYTGDGSLAVDYHVDVYTSAGAVLDTHARA